MKIAIHQKKFEEIFSANGLRNSELELFRLRVIQCFLQQGLPLNELETDSPIRNLIEDCAKKTIGSIIVDLSYHY